MVEFSFKNENIKITCCPENANELQEDGFDSAPGNGEFSFYFNDHEISFTAAKHGDGQGGSLTISVKMTDEIKKSLEVAMMEWRVYLREKKENEE